VKKRIEIRRRHVLAAPALLLPIGARAQDAPLKIGFLASYTGMSAANGVEMDVAIDLVMSARGDTIGGRKVEVLKRDTTGPVPDLTRRLAQELVVRDKVDLLAGIDFTPNALAVGGISTQAKMPVLVVNAATTGILAKSPYMTRYGFTTAQVAAPLAEWVYKSGIRRVFTLASDYGPGVEASTVFNKTFTAKGGTIVGNIGLPLNNPDFSSYVQRVGDVKPEAVFVFTPAGEQPIILLKTLRDSGLLTSGMKFIATGDLTEERGLDQIGDSALGAITAYHYSEAHDSPTNRAFVKAFYERAPAGVRPNFIACCAYDVFNTIYDVVGAQGGKVDPDKTLELQKGRKWESPRGPVMLDAETRDLRQNVYIRRVERVDGKLQNVEIETIPMVPAPASLS
jgi:branched-chain amino acid transport system substrate-binding protein